jgi:hypothetical protein
MAITPPFPDDEPDTLERWYDKDPALAKAMYSLRDASDGYQAQVALNIIGIVVEHYAESEGRDAFTTQQELLSLAERKLECIPKDRWYDMNSSLRSAMQLLQDTPAEYQNRLIPHISQMIELTLERNLIEIT